MAVSGGDPVGVAVIVPTLDAEATLGACLRSIAQQTEQPARVMVVDGGSRDLTVDVARAHGAEVWVCAANRSAQRNLGAHNSKEPLLLFVDADMRLEPTVLEACRRAWRVGLSGLVIPEQSFGIGFWARVKALERSYYQGVWWMEAARFVPRQAFWDVGGFDPGLVGSEDWDLDERLRQRGPVGRVDALIWHDEGALTLSRVAAKKRHYAPTLSAYAARHPTRARQQLSPLAGPIGVAGAAPAAPPAGAL